MDKKNKETYLAKIILIGNATVGKTAILQRYTTGKFDFNMLATIGVDFKT
jgi:GTPase SAR1 family protein